MRSVGIACLLLCLGCAESAGQIVSGTITGVVSDASGAVVAGAEVAAVNTQTGLKRMTTTNESGIFSLPQLPPGGYDVSASAQGFKKYEVSGVVLRVDQTVRVELRLEVGAITQEVQVSAAAAQIQSETSSLGQVIDRERIVELPLNGRNFMQLANISSGVAPAYHARSATITNQSGRADLAVHVSGGRGDSNSFLIDGVETRSSWFNSPSVLLSVDAVQEFKIDKNLFTAEYGQGSGLVSLVSKSGGNDLHGSAFEFLRNDKLDAANFFDNYFATRKAPFRQNQYGVTLGGAMVKNKLFYFGNWEALRSRRSSTLTALVPTPQQLAGDLAGLSSTRRDPSGALAIIDPSTSLPFPGNRIPSNRISAVTRNFIKYTPAPNANIGGRNFVTTKSTNRDDDQWGIRGDYQASPKDSIFGRYTDFDSTLYRPGVGVLAGNVFPYAGRNVVVQHTRILSPKLLNVFKFGYNRARVYNTWEITPASIANEIGLKIRQVPEEYGLPGVSLTGGYYAGGGTGINQGNGDHLFQFSDTISWVKNRHIFKFGGDVRLLYPEQRLGLSNNGAFTFDGRYSGSPVADFLLGNPSAMTAQIGLGVGRWRSKSLNFFIADDIKLTSRLTLNLGVRYEYDQPVWERDHREGYVDATLQKFVVGIPREQSPIKREIPQVVFDPNLRRGIWSPDRNNWGPRVGFAYRATNSTVIRGGYGVFYSKTQGNEWQFKINAPPLVFTAALTGNINTPNLSWDRDAFPDPADPNFPLATLSPFSVDPRDRTPYLQQWNLSVEQSLGASLLFEAAYAGSVGHKLAERVNINQATLPNPASPTPIAARRRFRDFGDILSSNWQENSSYNGLQTRLEKRFSGGLSFLLGYTWSHSIDTASRGSGGSWHQNAYRLRDDRGSSDFDVRHRFTYSYVYQLPFGKGKKFLGDAGRLADLVAGGWTLSGITSLMSGNPYSVTVAGDRANVGGFAFQRANRSCNGNLDRGSRTIDRYFDTACFTTTPLGTFGGGGRNIVEIPGLNNWDFSALKDFRVTERARLQFRAELFNLFNHAQFGQPDLSIDSRFVGEIRGARDARIVQFGLKALW
ncbi:MAG: TonB-dependent receptor [Acidobacteria bacterium]|nr:TonB-dependent receptor [Acidobacteriota bacterium]